MDRKFAGWMTFAVSALVLTGGFIVSSTVAGCGKKNGTSKKTIIAYGRENNSGTYMYFKEHVLANQDFAADVQTLPGTAAVINAVSKDPRSIGYGGIGYAKGVKILRIKKDAASPAIEPSMINVISGTYPISRNLYFYTVGEPTGNVREFIEWVLGDEGQKICEVVGFYPLPEDRKISLKAEGGTAQAKKTITVKGSDTMVILGQRWAERYMDKKAGSLVQVTGGGSGTGIAALINGGTDVCQASRPMKQSEKDQVKQKFGKDVFEIAVALDGIAVFVHESCPVDEASLEQLKGIYTGKVTNWSELGWNEK
jgi:ABC-type phosphate transport system substrate-binding protein